MHHAQRHRTVDLRCRLGLAQREAVLVEPWHGITTCSLRPRSTAIEDLYESYYTMVGEPYDDTAFDGRSDYQAFIENDIPSGGLFTGAEVLKTAAQQGIWGGVAGEQFDQNYHEVGDTFANNNDHALEVNSDLIAFAMLYFSYSTESVNGVPGINLPGPPLNLPTPAGPEGTFPPGGGHGPGPIGS
jgi:Zn-dependent M28 family amino/carboxypeptidase